MKVSVGTDIPSMVGGGILPQLRIAMAAEMHRINQARLGAGQSVPNPPAITARQMLEMATIGGARGLGLDRETGSLTPGKAADLLLIRAESPLTAPLSDAAGLVLMQASAGEIETVLVGGRLLKAGGRLPAPGAPALFARLQARAEEMAAAAAR
jgi:cytosine/adenosine deaminase-related metal-dependent hydrolase